MPNSTVARKNAFKAALAARGETIADFLASAGGISRTQLRAVLAGERDSERLNALIDDKIASVQKRTSRAA